MMDDESVSNEDNGTNLANKKPRIPSPATQRIMKNADIALIEASRTITDFNKRSIDKITKEGEEMMNLPKAWPDKYDDDDDL